MHFRIYWKVLIWSLLMLMIFLAPSASLPDGPETPFFDKFIHIGIFAVFSFLLITAIMQHKGIISLRFPLILNVLLYTLIFGSLIELAQSSMDLGREGDIYDLISDLVGYFLGLLGVFIFKKNKLRD